MYALDPMIGLVRVLGGPYSLSCLRLCQMTAGSMLVCTGSDTCNANLISGGVEAYRHVNWICRLACSYRTELTGYSLHTSGFGNQ